MKTNDKLRFRLQVFFFITVSLLLAYIYYLKKNDLNTGSGLFVSPESSQVRKDFYPDGRLRAAGRVKNFEKDGKWIYYDMKGNEELIETYDNGKLIDSEKPE